MDDGVAVCQSKLQLKRKMCLLRHTATVDLMNIYFTYFHYAFVMPCVPRTLHSFGQSFLLPSVIALTSQLVLARSVAAFVPCGGNKEAATAPIVRARLVPRLAPPHPHTPSAGARSSHRDQRCRKVHRLSK